MKQLSVLLLLVLLMSTFSGCGTRKEIHADTSLFDVVCSADEALEQAKTAGIPVMENLRCTAGQAVWDDFYQAVSADKESQVVCLMYYTLDRSHMTQEAYEAEKDDYPMAFFTLLSYDGEQYTVTVRQSSETEPESEDTFPYLRHFTGKMPAQSHYSAYDAYVLVDDPNATMEGIWAGMVSSSPEIASGYRHHTVYMNYMD